MQTLGKPIAVGRTSEIFSWDNNKVLKLGYPLAPSDWIVEEFNIGKHILDLGLPIPKVYERVRINDREGIVFEKIEGLSLEVELCSKPWNVKRYARMFAELHTRVHKVPAPVQLGSQQDWVKEEVITENRFLTSELRHKVMALLDTLPDGNRLCHGDFHPGNIVMTKRGPVIIDWMTASRGNAVGDVARTSVLLKVGKSPVGPLAQRLLDIIGNIFHSAYIKAYVQLRPEPQQQFKIWQAVMAASILGVSIPEETEGLLNIIYTGIQDCGS